MCYYEGVLSIVEYVDERNRSPFGKWFATLDAVTAAKVTVMVERLAAGNISAVKGLGADVKGVEYATDTPF